MLCTTPSVEHVSCSFNFFFFFFLHKENTELSIFHGRVGNSSSWMLRLCVQVGDEESREQLIKTHYMARVGELTTQLQISDSKAVHFHSEVNTTSSNTHTHTNTGIFQLSFFAAQH